MAHDIFPERKEKSYDSRPNYAKCGSANETAPEPSGLPPTAGEELSDKVGEDGLDNESIGIKYTDIEFVTIRAINEAYRGESQS